MFYKKDKLFDAFETAIMKDAYGSLINLNNDEIAFKAHEVHTRLIDSNPAYSNKFNKFSEILSKFDDARLFEKAEAIGQTQSSMALKEIKALCMVVPYIPLMIRGSLAVRSLINTGLPHLKRELA